MILSALTAIFVASPAVDAVADDDVVIKVGTVLEPDDFNPFSMTTGISYMVAWMMFEMLYTIGPELEPYPQLAESYEASADGLIWTYFLAEDSYWHDGEKVTAHDVAFTFNMIMENPKPCALLGDYLSGFVYPVVATDDYTVQITLERPKATMLSITVPILPEHLWADVVEAKEIKTVDMFDSPHFPDGPVGSGPMILKDYEKDLGFIRLLKQDPYHRLDGIEVDSINVDEILFVIYANEGAMTTALETGEIDVVDGVPELMWEAALDYANVEGQSPGALDLTEAGFNCASRELRESLNDESELNFPDASTNYETCNISVRQAITMATDRTLIVRDILQGLAEEADSLIPIATPDWHYYVPDEEKFHFDIDAANDLLDQWYSRDDDGDGIRENNTSGAELEFDFYYIRSTTRDQLTAGKMELWCQDIGVQLNLIDVSEGALYGLWFNLQYDMFIWNWQPDVDPTFLLSVLTTDQIPDDYQDYTAWSDAFYSNPVYDQLFEDQKNAMNFEERQAIVHEMQRIVYRDCPYICLWYPFSLIAYRTDAFMNFPDMERYVGTTPDSIWFYFEILPFDDAANDPPYDVYAGEDAEVYVGDDKTFSGSAEDLDNSQEELTWTWIITEEDVETTLDGQTVTHTFDTICVAEVMLSVSDPEGLSSSDSLTVTVLALEIDAGPDMGEVVPVPLTGYIGEEVTWTAQAMDLEQGVDGAGLLFTWDWGDGSPNTVDLMYPVENDTFVLNEQTHTWSAAGSYVVTVSVWDGYGVETDTSHNVSVTSDYEVSANAAPDGPDISPIDGIVGVEVSCVATAVDPDPDVLIFTWDWGDDTYTVTTHDTSSAPGTPVTSVVDHTWSTAGTHAVTVYVDDGEAGHNMSADVNANIVAAGEESPPSSISLDVAPYPRYVDEELTLNISAYDANGDALIVTVEFGDDSGTASQTTVGGTGLQYAEFVHTYTSEGTFTVTMYVDDGTTNVTETDDLEIVPPIANRPPVVTLQSTYTFSLGVEREIRPSKAMDPDEDDFSVWYDWGDDTPLTSGDPDDGFAASHTYDSVGTYTLIAWADDGDLNVSVEASVSVPSGLGWITGYVWDADGEPIEGALVSINGTDTHENVDVLGLYNISVVPGTYEVVASANGYSNETADVSIEMDVGSWSNFTLVTTSGSVTGQVLDSATETPIAHALVELYQTGEENASYEKETDETGSFEIVLVDEGTYEVVVSRNGYETNETVDVTVTSGDTASLTIYLTAEEGVGLSTTAIAAIAALAIIAAVAAAALLLKRKKGSEPELPEDEPSPEQTAEPPKPPET